MPDSVESRLGRLERDAAALHQRVEDVAHDVEALAPVRITIAEIKGDIRNVCDQLENLRQAVAEDRAAARERGEQVAAELQNLRREQEASNRSSRNQLIAGVTTIIVALIGVVSAVLAAGVVH